MIKNAETERERERASERDRERQRERETERDRIVSDIKYWWVKKLLLPKLTLSNSAVQSKKIAEAVYYTHL